MTRGLVATLTCVAALVLSAAPAWAVTFSNTAPMTGNPPTPCTAPSAPFTPYPSTIAVSGMTGTITDVNVSLKGMNNWPGDFEVLLVGPANTAAQSLVVLSDSGTADVVNHTLNIDDQAAAPPPQNSGWGPSPSTFKPADYAELTSTDTYPAPAPAPVNKPAPTGSATLASTFNGANPNGTWRLYVLNDACDVPAETITAGWSLDIAAASLTATTTTVSSSVNPSSTGQSVSFTAAVAAGGPVTSGTVSFTEGATTLAANVPVNASGNAVFTTSALAEGNHVITATFNANATFATSNGSTNQRVDSVTVVTANTYCNTGPVTIPTIGAATPYPSHMFVTGVPGPVGKVTVQLKNVTHTVTDDIDVLLAGPAGQNLVLLSDAGNGLAGASNVSVTFDDAAPGSLPTGSWGATGSSVLSKPVNHPADADAFPAPAPAVGASTTLLAAFGGVPANGTWKLHVVDDGAPDAGTIAGGWCLTITALDATPPATTVTRTPGSPNGLGGFYTSDVRVTVAATDVGSGVAETRCVLDPAAVPANFDALPAGCAYLGAGADVAGDGAHVVYAASRDVAGNKGPVASSAFAIDRTAPVVTIVSAAPASLGPGGASTVTWHAGENGSFSVRVGAATCATGTEVDSGSYTTSPAGVTTQVTAAQLGEGANTIRVCVSDSAGNAGSNTTTITRTTGQTPPPPPPPPPPVLPPPVADTAAPVVTIISATASPLGAGVVRWRANENGTFRVRVRGTTCATGTVVDSGDYATAPEVRTTTIPAGALTTGINAVRVCVTDAADLTGLAATTVARLAPRPFSIAKVTASRLGTIRLTLVIPGPGTVSLKLTRRTTVGGRTIVRTYASARRALPAAATTVLKIKPSRKVLRSLPAGRRMRITVRAAFRATTGAASTKTARVTVKLVKP